MSIPLHPDANDGASHPSEPLKSLRLTDAIGFDRDRDGHLSPREFLQLCATQKLSPQEARLLFRRVDINGDGALCSRDDLTGDGAITAADAVAHRDPRRAQLPYGQLPPRPIIWRARQEGDARRERENSVRRSQEIIPLAADAKLYQFSVTIPDLPEALDGTRVLHLTDLHLTPKRAERAHLLRRLNELLRAHKLQPDLVALTGDIVDAHTDDLTADALTALSSIAPDAARFAVLGNHDYRDGNGNRTAQKLTDAGYTMLTNRSHRVALRGETLVVSGLDDDTEGSPDVAHLDSPDHPHILLVHNLDALHGGSREGIDLVLSGHLHSGEVDLGIVDGTTVLRLLGEFQNRNSQKRGWKALTPRTLSYIGPGLATHCLRFNTEAAGVTLLTLRAPAAKAD